MNSATICRTILAIAASAVVLSAAAQGIRSQDIVGTWILTTAVATLPDGTKADTFGAKPRGQAIFTQDGHFSVIFARDGLPKFASGTRVRGTPEENQAVVQGTIAYFGTYSVDSENALVTNVDGSTFPAWTGQTQKRKLTLNGDNLEWAGIVGSQGGTMQVVLKRVR